MFCRTFLKHLRKVTHVNVPMLHSNNNTEKEKIYFTKKPSDEGQNI
jgi:hypothetical protein